mmetsp:Transcript_19691/g.49881  ORF Transcript_19691/g.49881 Transcript_19691/m.49881 type:complete len:510 (-) Transcript_19691:271-1800(-)
MIPSRQNGLIVIFLGLALRQFSMRRNLLLKIMHTPLRKHRRPIPIPELLDSLPPPLPVRQGHRCLRIPRGSINLLRLAAGADDGSVVLPGELHGRPRGLLFGEHFHAPAVLRHAVGALPLQNHEGVTGGAVARSLASGHFSNTTDLRHEPGSHRGHRGQALAGGKQMRHAAESRAAHKIIPDVNNPGFHDHGDQLATNSVLLNVQDHTHARRLEVAVHQIHGAPPDVLVGVGGAWRQAIGLRKPDGHLLLLIQHLVHLPEHLPHPCAFEAAHRERRFSGSGKIPGNQPFIKKTLALTSQFRSSQVDVRMRKIHFVERKHQGDSKSVGLLNHLFGLDLSAFLNRHQDYSHISHLGSSSSHNLKHFVARGVHKRNAVAIKKSRSAFSPSIYSRGEAPEILSDTPWFSRSRMRPRHSIQESGLPVIDVPQHSHHGHRWGGYQKIALLPMRLHIHQAWFQCKHAADFRSGLEGNKHTGAGHAFKLAAVVVPPVVLSFKKTDPQGLQTLLVVDP